MAGAVELRHMVAQSLSLFAYRRHVLSNNCLTAIKSREIRAVEPSRTFIILRAYFNVFICLEVIFQPCLALIVEQWTDTVIVIE